MMLTPKFSDGLYGQNTFPGMDIGVEIAPGVQLTLTGGDNGTGKLTRIIGNSINFGVVTFTKPELISNGDAYLSDGKLHLEAVIDLSLEFGGANAINLDITKLSTSGNAFESTSFSLSTNRGDNLLPIYDYPRQNRIGNFTQSADTTLRMVFVINPQQHGRLSDRFQIEATTL